MLLDLSEMLTLTPAACLDYFDAIYLREDLDGEHAGFSPSGHLLRNESILNELDAEYDHLPLQLTRPLAPIQVWLSSSSSTSYYRYHRHYRYHRDYRYCRYAGGAQARAQGVSGAAGR